MKLKTKLKPDVACIRKNTIPNLTLISSLATVSLLLPYPITALPFDFHCITGIDFIYHPSLSHNHVTCIEFILLIIKLLIYSFHWKYIFLFSHRDPHESCPFESLVRLIQSIISSWNISTHSILSHHLGNNISWSRSFLYLYPIKLLSPSIFIPQSTQSFLNPASWLSSTFNTHHFSHFTTTSIINTSPLVVPSLLFSYPKFKRFLQQKPGIIPAISNSVVGSLHPVLKPSYISCSDIFDGWFGITLKDTNFLSRILGLLSTSVSITLNILIVCTLATLLWLQQTFKTTSPRIKLLS